MSEPKHNKNVMIPASLWNQLQSAKTESNKSMNQEIIDRLASTFSETPTPWRELI